MLRIARPVRPAHSQIPATSPPSRATNQNDESKAGVSTRKETPLLDRAVDVLPEVVRNDSCSASTTAASSSIGVVRADTRCPPARRVAASSLGSNRHVIRRADRAGGRRPRPTPRTVSSRGSDIRHRAGALVDVRRGPPLDVPPAKSAASPASPAGTRTSSQQRSRTSSRRPVEQADDPSPLRSATTASRIGHLEEKFRSSSAVTSGSPYCSIAIAFRSSASGSASAGVATRSSTVMQRAHRASPAASRGRAARAGSGSAASPRRLIQTILRPSSRAGAASWKRLAPTWTCARVGARALEEPPPVPVRGLVRADLLGRDDDVERHPERLLRRRDQGVVGVREDREVPAAVAQLGERLRDLQEGRPLG